MGTFWTVFRYMVREKTVLSELIYTPSAKRKSMYFSKAKTNNKNLLSAVLEKVRISPIF
jgi:hypothetical protein